MSKTRYSKVVAHDYTEEEAKRIHKAGEDGNIPAMLEIIMHNQLVINHKLNRLLKPKNKQ